jgi:NADH-quinone oxidoreductase subunit A
MDFQFGAVLIFAIVGVIFALGALVTGYFLRPKFPGKDKEAIYECGERPVGGAWYQFNPRFYLIALAFIIFEVDIALTFPVVVVYADWTHRGAGWIALAELVMFTLILVVGLAWAWAHGDLEWIKKLSSSSATVTETDAKPERRAAAG